MQCRKNDIKELLPAYLADDLAATDRSFVENHIASCEDCSGELAMLKFMIAQPVPDPGEAFWNAFPGRVRRAVAEAEQAPARRSLGALLASLSIPRPALAATAVLLVAVATAAVLRLAVPTPPPIASRNEPQSLEDLAESPATVSDMTAAEMAPLNDWAETQLAALGDDFRMVSEARPVTTQEIEDDLSSLNQRELEQVAATIEYR